MATHRGMHNADRYAEAAPPPVKLAAFVIERLGAPEAGERVLDLGSGEGTLTRHLAEQGHAVVGVDAGAPMAHRAHAQGVDVAVGTAQELPFTSGVFGTVVSNAVLHWIPADELPKVFGEVRRVLRPEGEFIAAFGAEGNQALTQAALRKAFEDHGQLYRNPWHFATLEEISGALSTQGFTAQDGIVRIEPRDQLLPNGMAGWLDTFIDYFSPTPLESEVRAAIIAQAVELLRGTRLYNEATGEVDRIDYVRAEVHVRCDDALARTSAALQDAEPVIGKR